MSYVPSKLIMFASNIEHLGEVRSGDGDSTQLRYFALRLRWDKAMGSVPEPPAFASKVPTHYFSLLRLSQRYDCKVVDFQKIAGNALQENGIYVPHLSGRLG